MKTMKRIIALLCTLCLLVQPIAIFGATDDRTIAYSTKIENPELEFPVDEKIYEKNGAFMIEAEDLDYNPANVAIIEDEAASGGKALKVISAWAEYADALPIPDWTLTLANDTTGKHYYWVRARTNASYTHFYLDNTGYGTGTYTVNTIRPDVTGSTDYFWFKFATIDLIKRDTYNYYMKHRHNDLVIDKFIITTDADYTPEGADATPFPEEVADGEVAIDTSLIPLYPKEGQHPRLYFTEDKIPKMKERFQNQPVDNMIYEKVKKNAEKPIPEYDNSLAFSGYSGYLTVMNNRAFLYALGELDEASVQEALDGFFSVMENLNLEHYDSTYLSRYAGDVMKTGAYLYDWAYDLWTPELRQKFIDLSYELCATTEQGWPPTKRQFMTGHGTEEGIYNDCLTVAIAIYDEDTVWYNTVAPLIFGPLLTNLRNWMNGGYQGSVGSYFEARLRGVTKADWMFRTLGYNGSIILDNADQAFLTKFYRSLPNGIWFSEDDDYTQTAYKYNNKDNRYNWLYCYYGSNYDNEYLMRQGMIDYEMNGWTTDCLELIMIDFASAQTDSTELPLSAFTSWPLTSMSARTSWQMGDSSPAAVAHVNMREVTYGDHQHRDIGGIQFYYKGFLAQDSGYYTYEGGSSHKVNYQDRSIAHNVLLVDNFDENFYKGSSGTGAVNDGGQKYPQRNINYRSVEQIYSLELKTAENKAKYAGPNAQTPAFSYISSDISSAYNYEEEDYYKIEKNGYERSVVFLDLFNDDYPAALVVYDNVSSTDPSYKKTWLIHSELEPTVDKTTGTITIVHNDNEDNGKLVNKTLTPALTNANFEVIGGEGREFEVNGINYPIPIKHTDDGCYGKWRVELSPISQVKDDKFLNVMYVTDYDKNLPELAIYKEFGTAYTGATIMDRMVTFSLNRDNITEKFNLTVRDNGYETVKVLLTDIATGKWQVTGGGIDVIMEAKEGENVLCFEGAPGYYQISPAVTNSEPVNFDNGAVEKSDDFGDFRIVKNRNLMYQPKPGKLDNGACYVAVDGIFTQLGDCYITENNGTSITLSNDTHTLTITADSMEALYDGKPMELTYMPKMIYGELYAPLNDYTTFLSIKDVSYSEAAMLLKFTALSRRPLAGVDNSKLITPISVTGSPHDGSNTVDQICDRDLSTYYCTIGDGNWFMYDFGEVVDVEKVGMACYGGTTRKQFFDVLMSDDGKNWKTIFENGETNGKTNDLQYFKVRSSGRYMKVVVHGTTQGANGYNSIYEFIALKK